ncbi:cupin domain-containing protein [Roseibium salinum]|nr:cupin domain-containing protein [Roseibium salinum]
MARIDAAEASGGSIRPKRPPAPAAHQEVPLPLQRYIGSSLSEIPWKFVAPGVHRHRIRLEKPSGSSFYMLKIASGMAMPEHGHGGAEMTLILSGAYRDALGRFGPGDIADLDEHVEHQPRVEPGAPCICIVATEAPTRFKGLLSRLMQRVIGI